MGIVAGTGRALVICVLLPAANRRLHLQHNNNNSSNNKWRLDKPRKFEKRRATCTKCMLHARYCSCACAGVFAFNCNRCQTERQTERARERERAPQLAWLCHAYSHSHRISMDGPTDCHSTIADSPFLDLCDCVFLSHRLAPYQTSQSLASPPSPSAPLSSTSNIIAECAHFRIIGARHANPTQAASASSWTHFYLPPSLPLLLANFVIIASAAGAA